MQSRDNGCLEYSRKKVVGEPDEGKPHVRFEVAGNGNQDMVQASEALPWKRGANGYAEPTSQAPFPDPTSRPSYRPGAPKAKWLVQVAFGEEPSLGPPGG